MSSARGLLLIALGASMFFGGVWKTRQKWNETFTRFRKAIDTAERESQNWRMEVFEEKIKNADPKRVATIFEQIQQNLTDVYDLYEDFVRQEATSNFVFCKILQATDANFTCERVNKSLDAMMEIVRNTSKILNKRLNKTTELQEERATVAHKDEKDEEVKNELQSEENSNFLSSLEERDKEVKNELEMKNNLSFQSLSEENGEKKKPELRKKENSTSRAFKAYSLRK